METDIYNRYYPAIWCYLNGHIFSWFPILFFLLKIDKKLTTFKFLLIISHLFIGLCLPYDPHDHRNRINKILHLVLGLENFITLKLIWSGLWGIVSFVAWNSVPKSSISIERVVFGFLRLLKIDTKCSRIIKCHSYVPLPLLNLAQKVKKFLSFITLLNNSEWKTRSLKGGIKK